MKSKIEEINAKIVSTGREGPTYQQHREPALAHLIKHYELDNDAVDCPLERIADFATELVNNQIFRDGNHRTAVAVCYYLNLYKNNQLLRIQPYLLYAAVDFEYFKSSSGHEEWAIFQSNALLDAMRARAISGNINSMTMKNQCFESIMKSMLELPDVLLKINQSGFLQSHPKVSGNRYQRKLFFAFAGASNQFNSSLTLSACLYSKTRDRSYKDVIGFSKHSLSSQSLSTSSSRDSFFNSEDSTRSVSPESIASRLSI